MNLIRRTASPTALIVATTLVLSACGGGGGGVDNPPETPPASTPPSNGTSSSGSKINFVTTMTGVNGFRVNYTPNGSNFTGFTGEITNPVRYGLGPSLDSFSITDGASTYSQTSLAGIGAGTFAELGGVNLGGTRYIHGRFGWMRGVTTEANGSTSAWYTPFALASNQAAAPANASYAGLGQALVYLQGDYVGGLQGASGYATCDTSASYTASTKTLQLTLGNCTTGVGFNISGGFTLSNGTGTTTTSLTAQQPSTNTYPQTMTSTTVDSGNFLLAGPNGEELVGAATIKGSIAPSTGTGSSNPAIFLVVFGGKKQ